MKILRLVLIGLILSLSTYIHADGCFKMLSTGNVSTRETSKTFFNDTAFALPKDIGLLEGFSISGSIINNSPEYVVRVILKDINGNEHLVMEAYEELYSDNTIRLNGYAEETALLNGVQADSLLVFVSNATLQLDSINYNATNGRSLLMPDVYRQRFSEIRGQQVQAKVDMINAYNDTHDRYWWAGVTDLALKSYEDRKTVLSLPDNASSMGLEYYVGGLFEMGSRDLNPRTTGPSKYIESFDWRNRHGRNWLTPAKHQGDSGYCVAFAVLGCAESLVKLYFNTDEDYDLSEQMIACECRTSPSWTHGLVTNTVLNYLRDNGICEEEAYPFQNDSNFICNTEGVYGSECVKISGYNSFTISGSQIDRLKDSLIHKGPLPGSYYWKKEYNDTIYTGSHKVLLVGYGVIHVGDTVNWYDDQSFFHSRKTIREGDPLIGKTYWIFKNSYGTNAGYNQNYNGYQYIVFNNYSHMGSPNVIYTPITTLSYTDSGIVVEDTDGDGYYFWGIGPKPAHAPAGIPDEPDGDDSNADYGPMNKYGYLKVLNPNVVDTIMVNDSVTIDNTEYLYNHFQVNSGGVLTIALDTEFWGDLSLNVKNGGTLIVDGATFDNVKITLESGSHLSIMHGGVINIRSGNTFYAPLGATVNISEGMIH